ncbi:hypothetical protein C0993_012739 [Termitomyces sp. T159_Od127]|nr:hypothetical protein C0993_012739 [Termitomyces sp. T159_Od127]
MSLYRTAQNLPALPPELYRNIINWITDRQDLCSLSLVSRVFSAEAQRALYSVVDLAQNTRAPVLWADTILRHPQKALAVRALTLRLDLTFIIVPDLLLSSLQSIAQALRALQRLSKLVLVGHPLAMMHPIHTWILDGCTANLRTFHNSLFPLWAVIPFLSRHLQIREWKQAGKFIRGIITDETLPHLTTIDVHISSLASFPTPRSLTKIRLEISNWSGITAGKLEALSRFGPTLTTLVVEDSSTTDHFELAKFLARLANLAKAIPNLKTLAYTKASILSAQDILSSSSIENLSKFEALETLVLGLRRLNLCFDNHLVKAVAEHAFNRCPSLRCVALKDERSTYLCRRQGSCITKDDVDALFSDASESDPTRTQESVCPSRKPKYPKHNRLTSHSGHV